MFLDPPNQNKKKYRSTQSRVSDTSLSFSNKKNLSKEYWLQQQKDLNTWRKKPISAQPKPYHASGKLMSFKNKWVLEKLKCILCFQGLKN